MRPQLAVNIRAQQYDGGAASPFPGVPFAMFSIPLLPMVSLDSLTYNIRPIAVEMLVLWPRDVDGLKKLNGLLLQNWQALRTCVEQFQTTATLEPTYIFFPRSTPAIALLGTHLKRLECRTYSMQKLRFWEIF